MNDNNGNKRGNQRTKREKKSSFTKKMPIKENLPTFVNVSATTHKSNLRTERKKVKVKAIKNTSEVDRYKASIIKLCNGFSCGSEIEVESVLEAEVVTVEKADKYCKRKHVEIVSMSRGTKIRCVYCKSVFTLSTSVTHLCNECKNIMYNLGEASL